ncbi:FadR family transcriptional regulator [Bariatricus massiliensis]|uniref:FadR family transcriptional regulator n=1 Tax=Bariatricus massiliensis TaxID=1745713 RepID=A0ABS8DEB9_9FIRM|nr:FadR/GntR family transcriptional regulator [Bariatricus massiliensis]MCB7302874.1 FadR family transcriptional regulator [Bariatricus massiliensis]MCB7374090.1 FadR family transcriptional regulator [Bariatricus massiliensis]MCB7386760.1 FadR family transcriptional regulator [Bariatricus massiliensis]MCB7410922.1 FadR family transcriptional regulator [Bariatricus massiliensis]MCQ5251748.1 FadR family transcriptional regulator [Bariatricus massiliensis]
MEETKKKQRLSDSITEELEKMIIEKFRPGDKIPPEMELAERFGVGRSTVRESMKALTAKGIIVRRNEGTFVSVEVNRCLIEPLSLLVNMEIGNLENLVEMRKLLELGCIRIAAERITDEELKELEKLNWQMHEPGADGLKLQNIDIQFHNKIVEATGNQLLVELLNAVRKVMVQHSEDPYGVLEVLPDMLESHGELIDALKKHDPAKAYESMETYLERSHIYQ